MENIKCSIDWFYQKIRDNGGGFTAEDLSEWHNHAKAKHKIEHELTWISKPSELDRKFGNMTTFEEYYRKTFNPAEPQK